MCIILFAYRFHPRYPLVLAANRDEFRDRATAPASFWDTDPPVLAGKDLRCGGTWLGITRDGRLSALANYRDPSAWKSAAPSRGRLVREFLLGKATAEDYLECLKKKSGRYNGFTLLFGDSARLFCFSNRGTIPPVVPPGVHGLSNHLLDTPWPKVVRGKELLKELLANRDDPPLEELFAILADEAVPADHGLPDTGVGLETERVLAPLFIRGPGYGTRSSTVALIDDNGNVTFAERTFDGDPHRFTTVIFRFRIEKPAPCPS